MKKIILGVCLLAASLFGIVSCSDSYDDTELKQMITELSEKVDKLEEEKEEDKDDTSGTQTDNEELKKALDDINNKLDELSDKVLTEDDITNLMAIQSILELYVNGMVSNKTYTLDLTYTQSTYLRRVSNESDTTIKADFCDSNGVFVYSVEMSDETYSYARDYNWYYYYVGSGYSSVNKAVSVTISAAYPIKSTKTEKSQDSLRDNLWYESFEIGFDKDAYMDEISDLIDQLYDENE